MAVSSCERSDSVLHHPTHHLGDGIPCNDAGAYPLCCLDRKAGFSTRIGDGKMIPADIPLRIVGDVHGDYKGFAAATATDHFIVQLGDLVDDGPDTLGVLELMFELLERRRGIFILGNHDFKLARALRGDSVHRSPALAATIAALDNATAARALAEITRAPAWITVPNVCFVHGGFHPAMLIERAPTFPSRAPDRLVARALYGQTTGRVTGSGKPERLVQWVDQIPAGVTIYCGHDQRSKNGRPLILSNRQGGSAVFLDTGAGKGGHLSWIDIQSISYKRD